MKNIKINSLTQNKRKIIIQLFLIIFILVILLISISTGKESLFFDYYYTEGQISQRDIYAPFDFPFFDKNSLKIEIKKDELIIQRGERVNQTQEIALNELQKLKKQPRKLYYILGIILQLLLFSVIITAYKNIYKPRVILRLKNIFLLCLLSLIIIFCTKAINMAAWSVFLIPMASVSMLCAILIDPGISSILTVILSIFVGIICGARFDVMGTMFAGGLVSINAVLNLRRRQDLTKAGLLVGLTNMVSIVAFGLINLNPINEVVIQSSWGLINGLISTIIVTGILPVFETIFGITTNISLLELSDLNQPLLKELVLKAPGTYHHSLVVGNLAESAAEAVGANTLLARVGAYFHDIGKLRMASYFSENQTNAENKHENLSPTISSLIIINHIKEGADLARKHRLGRDIIDIITQHHGNDVVYYFYHRALEKHDEEQGEVQPEDFRYPGPRPQSKEAAIVMLADSVEAASRSLPQPTPAKIEDLVKRIINNKFIVGQLDGCDLTLKDLHVISETFIHILNGIYHSRIEYPNIEQTKNEQNKNKELSEEDKNKPKEDSKSGSQNT